MKIAKSTKAAKPAALSDTITAAVGQTIQQATASISLQVPQQFATMTAVRQARINLLQRQAAALKAQPAAAAADVTALQTSIKAQTMSLGKLGAVSAQASTPTPSVPANGWVLQGRIRDANSQPMAKLTVILADQEKTWQQQYGYAFTDATGYFLLTYAPSAAVAPPAAGCNEDATETAAPAEDAAAAPSLFVQVLNESSQPVYFASQAFTPVTGVALYQDIANVSTQALGTAPPGEAAPPQAAK